ncbi:protein kinase [Marivirga sp. S37H4]|uniref:Protein kinase n=1 Tax=Marivirga aurantiaca TaxID=2802615 RepID=A0A934WYA2_9BACT|nr:protein kinase [Marivirga aurantiaca]MBK6265127.1 protein kinase [Marivirga aurantiaca]
MSKKRIFRKGQKFNDWTLTQYVGGGGNGEVWACQNSKGVINAIKLLKKIKPKAYTRFIDEITVIDKNSAIQGIIPIVEKHLPDKLNQEIPFYIMPLAESIEKKIRGGSIEDKVKAILDVAETLSKLHERKIYHRDIKPENILYYNSRFSLVDFGLVHYPDKKEVSVNNEEIGPKWTMAPEMRRESSIADGAKADIYSLAKTFWIFLTERKKGFDGQYSTESIIDLKKFYPESYTSPIDNLLILSTDNDPQKRPSVDEFISSLREWKKLIEDFHEQNQMQWFEIQTKLFPTSIPQRVIWEDINDIVKVLKVVCSFDNLNHVFFPRSGGLDLEDVRLSHEDGCIELDFQLIDIVKPKRLLFESFGYDYEWNYFRLETGNLEPSSAYEKEEESEDGEPLDNERNCEEVSELSPGEYYPYHILENRYYYKDDYLITDHARHVTRWFKGSFVMFCKRSTYNLTSSTYDGRHNKMTTDEFRKYIERNVKYLKDRKESSLVNRFQAEQRRNSRDQRLKHIIEERTVYRCEWCGDIVSEDGSELDSNTFAYNSKVINKYGDSLVKHVAGYCCIEKETKHSVK